MPSTIQLQNYLVFLETIEAGIHIDNFYELLLAHSDAIVNDTLRTQKHIVAKKLNLSAPKFSTIFPLLVANRGLTHDNAQQ